MTDDQGFKSSLLDGINRFQSARGKAFWQDVFSLLRGKSAELLSFEDIRARLRLNQESYKGLQDIPLTRVVGSVGRYKDFTSTFLPRKNEMQERWSRVYAVANSMMGLPPIEVYQVGEAYFVRDGNHRVSVAKQIGAKTIQAHVTELSTPVPFHGGMSEHDIDQAAAYAAFLEETGLGRTRVHHQPMRLTDPSRYPDMINLINVHRQIMAEASHTPATVEHAATDWYDNVFRPTITLMRKYRMMEEHPERTEADLFLWMVANLSELREMVEDDPVAQRETLAGFLRERGMAVPDDFLADSAASPTSISHDYVERAFDVGDEPELGEPTNHPDA